VKAALLASVLTAISMTAVLGQNIESFKTVRTVPITAPIGTWAPGAPPNTMPPV
jgi:hypothetical protein